MDIKSMQPISLKTSFLPLTLVVLAWATGGFLRDCSTISSNKLEFIRVKGNFLHRRYAIRLGRRYASAAVGVILLGLCYRYYENSFWEPNA